MGAAAAAPEAIAAHRLPDIRTGLRGKATGLWTQMLSATNYRDHKLTGFARVQGLSITYPPEQASLL
jgi:hypothetical protein